VILGCAVLLAVAFLGKATLPYLLQDPSALARYASRRLWILVHVVAATVALLTGPVQLWLGARGRTTRGHRRLGRVYVASVGVAAAAAFYLSTHTELGWVTGAGLTGLGIAWVVTTTLGVVAIGRGLVDQHREWMIRSYVVTFAFVIFRAFDTMIASRMPLLDHIGISAWFCWSVPLLLNEVVLQGRKILRVNLD